MTFKDKKSSSMACGLKLKECNGIGMKIAGETSGKCLKCPMYKKTNKS